MARSSAQPILSVVICTRDRLEQLPLALESLCRQTLSPEVFEVVVVDDGSADGTGGVCREFEGRLPLRCSHQRRAGIASARNHGVFFARGALILFLDDDLAEPALLQEHLETHRRFPEPRYAVLGQARLHPSISADPLMRFVAEVGSFRAAYRSLRPGVPLDASHFSAGRASCKRSFLLDRGMFDPRFRSGGEDVELAHRLSRHGFEVVYNPRALTAIVRAASVDELCERLYAQGRSHAALRRLHEDCAVGGRTRVSGAGEAWRAVEPAYDAILRSARELDRIVRTRMAEGLPVDELDLALLHRSYWAALDASEARGMVEEAGAAGATPG